MRGTKAYLAFPMVPHDMWHFDATAAPQLVTVTHNGKKVDAVHRLLTAS